MIGNYLKVALRNMMQFKTFNAINVIGLAIGLAATLVILLYIQFEFSYDTFHEHSDHLYRISVIHKNKGTVEYESHQFTPPIGPAMLEEFPEVEDYVRLSSSRISYFRTEDKSIKVNQICHADSSFFNMFTFHLVSGHPKKALADPFSVIISESISKILFEDENPLGKNITLDDGDVYHVTGVVKDPPENSHIKFNAIISFSTLYNQPGLYLDWNGGNQYITYIKLNARALPSEVNKKFPGFMWEHINKEYSNFGASLNPYLQPLKDIHLKYQSDSGFGLYRIYIFGAIALLILLMACVNFINLNTARAGKRAKEVGVRKVLGADKKSLIRQFLIETLLLSLLALIISFILIELFFPVFKTLVNKELNLLNILNLNSVWWLFLIILLVGIIAGGYPSFYMSSIHPVKTLKGVFETGRSKTKMRNILVVFQFTISITLIICTLIINNQLTYIEDKELGFDKEHILVIPLPSKEVQIKSSTLKQEFSQLADVLHISASSEVPVRGFTSNGYIPERYETPMMFHVVDVDKEFLKTYDIKLIKGRNFSERYSTDKNTYLINESLANILGWNDPIGKLINRNGDHRIIGVVKDFHYATLYDKIEPLIITNRVWRDEFGYLSLKIHSADISATLNSLEAIWKKFAVDTPFEYRFLNDAFNNLYIREQHFHKLFIAFSLLALTIALLGVFSLAFFSSERRTKEVGIRKVLGASVTEIISLLSFDLIKLVILANVVAWPIAWFIMEKLLQNFAYRIEISLGVFLLAGLIALFITLLTVGHQLLNHHYPILSKPYDTSKAEITFLGIEVI